MGKAALKGDTSLRTFLDSNFGNLKDLRLILNDDPNDDSGHIDPWIINSKGGYDYLCFEDSLIYLGSLPFDTVSFQWTTFFTVEWAFGHLCAILRGMITGIITGRKIGQNSWFELERCFYVITSVMRTIIYII